MGWREQNTKMTTKTGSTSRKPRAKKPDGYVVVATTAEIPPGAHQVVEAGEQSLVVFNAEGVYSALANICSHDNGPLGEGTVCDHEIQCPRHGARFDLRTGKVLSFPAIVDVPTYPVKVDGDRILVQITSGE
jgi:3-phenylpropionate/trans-cinnamate dioxygenase ferredoxin component